MKRFIPFVFSTLLFTSVFADQPPVETAANNYQPWFTGPLLTPTATVIPPGHYNIEPYIYYTTRTGVYNRHWNSESLKNAYSLLFQVPMQIGLVNRFDIQITPQAFYQEARGRTSMSFGDLPVAIDYQVLFEDTLGWKPKIKFTVGAKIPVAKYQKLNPDKYATDAIGGGSWSPLLALTIGKIIHIHKYQFLNLRANFQATLPNTVHVKGFNSYGGGRGTSGKDRIGTTYTGLIGLEYSLTQNWALALDIQYLHTNKIKFSGTPGTYKNGNTAINGLPSSEQLSLAPAFEYNWNANVGLIAGVWFSVAGRAAAEFCSGIVALNVYH